MVNVSVACPAPGLMVALVEAAGIQIGEAPVELREQCHSAAAQTAAAGMSGGDPRRQAIRQLLRSGGYKPSGRNKPAQEYLLRTVTVEGDLPAISNAVDLINLVSLRSGLPISLVSIDRLGNEFSLRFGTPGEKFVFNRTGQELDLEGLLCLCAVSADLSDPAGTPVKDSMHAKVIEQDRCVLACIYASRDAIAESELRGWAEELADGFRRFCGAESAEIAVR